MTQTFWNGWMFSGVAIDRATVSYAFVKGETTCRLSLTGSETFDLTGLGGEIAPRMEATLTVRRTDGSAEEIPVIVRLDTPVEIDYYRAGGILPYVLDQILA